MVESKLCFHTEDKCKGHHCPFHNPSDHHMKDWKMVLRLDKEALIERVCEHGIGHPDPDSAAFLYSCGAEWIGIHGCDGCCSPPKKKKMTIKELKELLTQISDANPGFDDLDDRIDCISCGNADDVYRYGEDNGRGDLARELLEKLNK